jgi:hypothetical protein
MGHEACLTPESKTVPLTKERITGETVRPEGALGGAGEHREPRIREAGDIVRDAAEQPDAYPKAHKARASLVPPHPAACAVMSFL